MHLKVEPHCHQPVRPGEREVVLRKRGIRGAVAVFAPVWASVRVIRVRQPAPLAGSPLVELQLVAIEGQNGFVMLDPPPVEWMWLDDTHIQVVFEMEAVGDGAFGIAGDLFTGNYFDHFVDDGHLVFPSGEVVLVG